MTVRISTNQVINASIDSMNNNLVESTAWQKKISSGQNYNKASDNVYAVSRGVELDFDLARLNIYKANQTVVANLHDSAQTQMESISSQLDSMRQILIQARNARIPTEIKTLQTQVEGMRSTILDQMVAKDAVGRPLFAGVVNDAQIEPNVYVKSGVSFDDAFKNPNNNVQNTDPANTHLIQSINSLVDYLQSRVAGTADAQLHADTISSDLQTSYDQINYAQQVSGGVTRQLDRSKSSLDQLGTSISVTSSELLDTNFAAASAAFSRSQTLLNAAQTMFAKLQQSNLFSKL